MWLKKLIGIFSLAIILAGCATSSNIDLTVHQINSLASPKANDGSFQGLEFLASPVPGEYKYRVNIMYLHGIGWTEARDADQLAGDFLGGIANAYDLDETDGLVTTICGEAPYKETDKTKTHIYIKATNPLFYETTVPGSQLKLDDLVCMDKQILDIGENLEFVVYRVFWDNIFWNSLQFPHVGQDDDRGSSKDIARLRKKYNRILKDDLVNYGFSDAVMYLGKAGEEIRLAVKAAMCSAALDAAGYDFARQASGQNERTTVGQACGTANSTSIDVAQFAYVTESLGSKIMFDVMRDTMTDNKDTVHDEMIRGSETYMLANQIALLSLADLTRSHRATVTQFPPKDRPRLIAMSELNDFLSYELVPFYEQIFKRSYRSDGKTGALQDSHREAFIKQLGFDVIDMRLEFADRIFPMIKSFVDPKDAHSGHAGEPELMKYMLCGAAKGKLRDKECLATEKIK